MVSSATQPIRKGDRLAAPKVVPQITPGTSKTLFDALLSSALDAAILVEQPFALPKSLTQQNIRQEPLLRPYNFLTTPPIVFLSLTRSNTCFSFRTSGVILLKIY
jgi:hypothetical protein